MQKIEGREGPAAARAAARSRRRDLLRAGITGAGWAVLAPVARRFAFAEERPAPTLAPCSAEEVAALARKIEDAPRERAVEIVAGELRRGVAERSLEAALVLAAASCIDPRPFGMGLHCVLMLHATGVLAARVPRADRLLPWMSALDHFKEAQETDPLPGGGRLRPWNGAAISADRAPDVLRAAIRAWDRECAEAALVALWRHAPGPAAFDPLWEFVARDRRSHGHKAIFASNLRRTLGRAGPCGAEAALRALVVSLLDGEPCGSGPREAPDSSHERCEEHAARLLADLPAGWDGPGRAEADVPGLLHRILGRDPAGACDTAAAGLASGALRTGDVWDALHLAASSLVLEVGLGSSAAMLRAGHAPSSANAIHFAFRSSRDPRVRLVLVLDAVAWMAQFAAAVRAGDATATRILDLGAAGAPESSSASAEELLSGGGPDAAIRVVGRASDPAGAEEIFGAAARTVVGTATSIHGYKHVVAMFEDSEQVSPRWRGRVVAAAASRVPSPTAPDRAFIARCREAVRGL